MPFNTAEALGASRHKCRLHHLFFGAVVLTALAFVFLLAKVMYYWATPEQIGRGKEIFEACIRIVPPILTLVIGFYFGRKSNNPVTQMAKIY